MSIYCRYRVTVRCGEEEWHIWFCCISFYCFNTESNNVGTTCWKFSFKAWCHKAPWTLSSPNKEIQADLFGHGFKTLSFVAQRKSFTAGRSAQRQPGTRFWPEVLNQHLPTNRNAPWNEVLITTKPAIIVKTVQSVQFVNPSVKKVKLQQRLRWRRRAHIVNKPSMETMHVGACMQRSRCKPVC